MRVEYFTEGFGYFNHHLGHLVLLLREMYETDRLVCKAFIAAKRHTTLAYVQA